MNARSKSPDARIAVRFLETQEDGRKSDVTAGSYGCPLIVAGEAFDCRFLPGQEAVYHLGSTMTTLSVNCPDCGNEVLANLGQGVNERNELTWFRSLSCPHCGCAIEEDGIGFPLPGIRQKLLDTDGTWTLVLLDTTQRSLIGKVLRESFGMDLQAVSNTLKKIPGPIWQGTKMEVNWLKNLLSAKGVAAQAARVVEAVLEEIT